MPRLAYARVIWLVHCYYCLNLTSLHRWRGRLPGPLPYLYTVGRASDTPTIRPAMNERLCAQLYDGYAVATLLGRRRCVRFDEGVMREMLAYGCS